MKKNKKIMLALSCFIAGLVVVFFGEIFFKKYFAKSTQTSIAGKGAKSIQPLFYSEIGEASDTLGLLSMHNPDTRQYTLELGKVKSESSAKKLISELNRYGFNAFYIPVNQSGRVFYLVSYGIYESEEKALDVATRLQSDSGFEAKIKALN